MEHKARLMLSQEENDRENGIFSRTESQCR